MTYTLNIEVTLQDVTTVAEAHALRDAMQDAAQAVLFDNAIRGNHYTYSACNIQHKLSWKSLRNPQE